MVAEQSVRVHVLFNTYKKVSTTFRFSKDKRQCKLFNTYKKVSTTF